MPKKPCNQVGCDNPGVYRFTWPGRDEAFICNNCVDSLRAVAKAIGLYLQIIPLEEAQDDPR